MLEDRTKIIMLYDFYGSLLTDRQEEYLQRHYLEDCSLMEIAEEYNVSRQAVHDAIKRAEALLNGFEEKLQLAQRWEKEQHLLKQLEKELQAPRTQVDIEKCRVLLGQVLQSEG